MPKKVRKKSAFTNKSAKKSAFTNKSAQKSTLKSTFGSSEPICFRMSKHLVGFKSPTFVKMTSVSYIDPSLDSQTRPQRENVNGL